MSESIKKLTEAYNTLYTSQELTESELTALERSAFVAGGGEAAKAKKNQTVAQIIAQGKLNLTKPRTLLFEYLFVLNIGDRNILLQP